MHACVQVGKLSSKVYTINSHFSFKAVAAFCINSTIVNDIFDCSVSVSSAASMVTIGYYGEGLRKLGQSVSN